MISKKLHELLLARGLIITTAESCTGGLLASSFVEEPGSSKIFECGFITYHNKFKCKLLNVSKDLINTHGVVSKEVAMAMASGALAETEADIALSTTGIAGPEGGTDEKPVGLVYIGLAHKSGKSYAQDFIFSGNRSKIRQQTVDEARTLLYEFICTYLPQSR